MRKACGLVLGMVCGCNGVTYENKCAAFSVGVSVEYAGAYMQYI